MPIANYNGTDNMANYPGAIPPFPNLQDIQIEYADQIESQNFREVTVSFCQKREISLQEFVGVSIGYLHGRIPIGIDDLTIFMVALGNIYGIDNASENQELYKAIKGIPAHSDGRIGYTFQRRRQQEERGVFLFLK